MFDFIILRPVKVPLHLGLTTAELTIRLICLTSNAFFISLTCLPWDKRHMPGLFFFLPALMVCFFRVCEHKVSH